MVMALEALEALEAVVPAAAEAGERVERDCLFCMSSPRVARLACGHSCYCRECLALALTRPRPECPTCRRPIAAQAVVVNDDVANQNTFVRPLPR